MELEDRSWSFGRFAPRNGKVIAAFFVCVLSGSGAISLILELDRSFEEYFKVSRAGFVAVTLLSTR
jgi:hypothetical protein